MKYRRYIFLLAMMTGIFLSCNKYDSGYTPTTPNPTVPTPPADQFFLKDIVAPSLPNPYYHFEYDQAGIITHVAFASGFRMYELIYDGRRLIEVRNNTAVNKDRLQYNYDNAGRVNLINFIDNTGKLFRRSFFTYDDEQLVKIESELNLDGTFKKERIMSFAYQPDGNLMDMTDQRFALGSQTASTYTDHYEQYDDKINKDGFSLIHQDFTDHLVLLPGVRFQKNNAAKVTRNGSPNNFTVNYTFTYNQKNVPLSEAGDFVWTSGSDAGKHFAVGLQYSYY